MRGSRHSLTSSEVYSWGDCENGVTGHNFVGGENYVPQIVSVLNGRGAVQKSQRVDFTRHVSRNVEGITGEGKFGRLGHGDERNAYRPQKFNDFMIKP